MQAIGLLTLTRQPHELLRRDRAGRLPRRQPGAGHRRHRRPAAAGAALLLRRHPADPARVARTSTRSRSTGRTHRSTTCCATASTRTPCTAASRRTGRTRSTAGARSTRAPTTARSSTAAVTVAGAKTRSAPASYDDHFSQVRQFWLSMTPVERDHIVLAYTFELAKCFEQTIRERQLAALANVDPELCARVAAGLGLPAPDATEPLADLPASPALSQVGGSFPADGRTVGHRRRRRDRRCGHRRPVRDDPRRGAHAPGRRAARRHARERPPGPADLRRLPVGRVRRGPRGRRLCPTRSSRCCSRSASGTPRRSAPGAPGPTPWPTPGSTGTPWAWSPERTATTCGRRCTR